MRDDLRANTGLSDFKNLLDRTGQQRVPGRHLGLGLLVEARGMPRRTLRARMLERMLPIMHVHLHLSVRRVLSPTNANAPSVDTWQGC